VLVIDEASMLRVPQILWLVKHYALGRVVNFHCRTAGGFRPGERWTVRETKCVTVTLESNGKVRQFKPSAKGKWDVLVPSTMQVSAGDQI